MSRWRVRDLLGVPRRRGWVWSPWMDPAEIDRVNGLEPPPRVEPRTYYADGEPVEMMDPGEGLLW